MLERYAPRPSAVESQATCILLLPRTLAEIQSRSSEETKSAIADAPACPGVAVTYVTGRHVRPSGQVEFEEVLVVEVLVEEVLVKPTEAV
jgi:hypothetical protein